MCLHLRWEEKRGEREGRKMKREEQERKTISRAHLGRDSVERERQSGRERAEEV